MDKVEFSENNSNRQGFNEPQIPVDPATGQPAQSQSETKKAFGRPNLPDFTRLREKAIKAEFVRKANEEKSIESCYTASLSNIRQLEENRNRLSALLAASPGEEERHQLLHAIGELDRKILLTNELHSILQPGTTSATSAVASLTQQQYQRAIQIKDLLFPQTPGKNGAIGEPDSLFPPMAKPVLSKTGNNDEDNSTVRKPYRPGRIKSFYQESRKSRQLPEEESSDE